MVKRETEEFTSRKSLELSQDNMTSQGGIGTAPRRKKEKEEEGGSSECQQLSSLGTENLFAC